MTFSILGFCNKTKMVGLAITTSSISVGSRCPWVKANSGAVSTQNITDPSIGNEVLNLLDNGKNASSALNSVMKDRNFSEYRQVAVIDINGQTSFFNGNKILGKNSVSEGKNCIAAGNLLKDKLLTKIMTDNFENNQHLHIADNLIQSLLSGVIFGGEEGPVHSAALLIAHNHSWPLVDLRIDWSEKCPVRDLETLWVNYKPQMKDYTLRAIDPTRAPSYGVPGDE